MQDEYRTGSSDTYSDVLRMFALSNPNHPQEFVDVVARVADDPAKDDEDVVDVE